MRRPIAFPRARRRRAWQQLPRARRPRADAVREQRVALVPECAECDAHWLPADEDRWLAYLTEDEPPELAFYCPVCAKGSSAS